MRWTFAAIVAWFWVATPAAAFVVYPVGAYPPVSLIVCNDGNLTYFPGTLPDAINYAPIFCANHGGVSEVTDAAVETAVQEIATCDAPSGVSVAQDLGGGSWQALTLSEVRAMIESAGGNPVELPQHRLVSVVVGGNELLVNPVPNLPMIRISAVYSDEHETGQTVGGPTTPSSCFEVPMPRTTAALLALAILAGYSLVARRQQGADS
jgi:hypothetical protein